jgi:hypothetical protein
VHGAGDGDPDADDDVIRRQKKLIVAAAVVEGVVPRRSCAACDEARRREYGCESDTERQEHWLRLEGGEVVKRCPYALAGPREYRCVQYAGLIESGILPDAGGWLDQAAAFTDAAAVALSARRDFARSKTDDRR